MFNSNLLKKLSLFSLVLAVLTLALYFIEPKFFALEYLIVIIIFFITNLIINNKLIKVVESRIMKFVNTFMLSVIIKLIIYTITFIVFLLMAKVNKTAFIIIFLILYLSYTIFDVVFMQNFLRKMKNKTD